MKFWSRYETLLSRNTFECVIYQTLAILFRHQSKTGVEYPRPPHDYPYHWFILDPKSKLDQVKVTKFKKRNAKNSDFGILQQVLLYTQHTFWSYLIRCINMKWVQQVLSKIPSGHDSVHRWMDGKTNGWTNNVKLAYPPFTSLKRGYTNGLESLCKNCISMHWLCQSCHLWAIRTFIIESRCRFEYTEMER